ncbi:hypothetical protein ACRAWG_35455 [Methylobacterium sp. P31]
MIVFTLNVKRLPFEKMSGGRASGRIFTNGIKGAEARISADRNSITRYRTVEIVEMTVDENLNDRRHGQRTPRSDQEREPTSSQ